MAKNAPYLSVILLSLSNLISVQADVRFGPYYTLGNTTNSILEATTTLFPGETQNPQLDRLALWAGMETNKGDLIQAIILSSNDAEATNCGGNPHVPGQWCIFASTLQNGHQVDGDTVPMLAGQGVAVHYLYDSDSGNYTQTASIDGQVVSTLSTNSGDASQFGTAVECQDQCQGLVNGHRYVNTTLRLAEADPSFAGTLVTNSSTATPLNTADNITFCVDEINVQPYTFAPGSS